MKKIIKSQWNLYKESPRGQEEIALFENALSDSVTPESLLELAKKFDPLYFKNFTRKEEDIWIDIFVYYYKILIDNIEGRKFEQGEDFVNFYLDILAMSAQPDEDENLPSEELDQKDFKMILRDIMQMSLAFYIFCPEFFIPNFFVMQFFYVKKFAEKYDIELPKVPHRSDYYDRCVYYMCLCNELTHFAVENELSQPELCAFIFGYEFPIIKEETENEYNKPIPGVSGQAWILTGNMNEGEKTMKYGFWQANQLTQKGDLMLFYEKSPVKKLNSIWIAQEDGVVDPFFYYYSNTYIGNRIDIPENMALTYQELKDSEYFKVENRGKKGNYVSKNFQDVSGWEVTGDDYKEIKRMLEVKGFDTSALPKLYEPNSYVVDGVECEDDVYKKMIEPLLKEMGWEKDKDYRSEVRFPAGRGKTDHENAKRPDYCLHLYGTEENLAAKVIIEAKYEMSLATQIKDNYNQALSYAKWANAEVLVICDRRIIKVYLRNSKGMFDYNKSKTFRWKELQNLEKFNELKHILDR